MRTKSAGLLFVGLTAALLVVAVTSLAGLPGLTEEGQPDEPPIEFADDEPLELTTPDATVSGTADVDDDTELQVTVVAENGAGEQFSTATLADVDEDGNFTTEFGLSDVAAGTPVTVSVSVNGGHRLGQADGFVVRESASVGLGEAPVTFDDDSAELSAETTTVSGTAHVDAGTELEVVVRSAAGGETPFFLVEETTVGEDGEFAVTYNLTDAAPGTETIMEVRAASDGALLGETEAVVVEPDDDGERGDGPDRAETSDVSIESPLPEDHQFDAGETVPIELSLEGTDVATVTFGAEDPPQNARFSATVRDENGDGTAVVYFDTGGFDGENDGYRAGRGTTIEDTASAYNEGLDVLFPQGYDVTVAPGAQPHYADGVLLTDRSIARVQEADDEQPTETAIVSPTPVDDPVAVGGTVPIELTLNDTDVATVTIGSVDPPQNARFTATVRDENGDGTVTVSFDTGGFDSENDGFAVDDGATILNTSSVYDDGVADSGLATIGYDLQLTGSEQPAYADGSTLSDRSVILLAEAGDDDSDDGTENGDEDGDDGTENGDGEGEDDGEEGNDDGGQTEDAEASVDGEEPLELDPENAVVSGTTTLEPGTELSVNLATKPGEDDPFFIPTQVIVDSDGTFEVELDLSGADPEPGTEAELSVSTADTGLLAVVDVVITEADQ